MSDEEHYDFLASGKCIWSLEFWCQLFWPCSHRWHHIWFSPLNVHVYTDIYTHVGMLSSASHFRSICLFRWSPPLLHVGRLQQVSSVSTGPAILIIAIYLIYKGKWPSCHHCEGGHMWVGTHRLLCAYVQKTVGVIAQKWKRMDRQTKSLYYKYPLPKFNGGAY